MPLPSFSTLTDLLEGMSEIHPERGIRIVSSQFRETYYSYSELHRRVLFHADHLRNQDIEAGQKVIVPLTTDIEVIASFLALIWLGAVPVSVSGQMAGQDRGAYFRQIAHLLERFSIDRLLTDRTMTQILAELGPLDPRISVDPYPVALDPDRPAPRIPAWRAREEDVALIQFSSGSTGDPKGVQITHGNIGSNLRLIVANDGRAPETTGLSWLPLYHDMGLIGGFLSNLVHHSPLVLMNPICFLMKPVSWLDYLSRYRCSITPVPSFAIDMCNTRIREHQLEARKPDLGCLEYVYDGAEPVSAEAIEIFYERFGPYGVQQGIIHPVYGMAEATLMITAPPRHAEIVSRDFGGRKVVSVGRPVGDFRLKIIDEDFQEVPAEVVGEIAIRGGSVTQGYLENEEENGRRFTDGWFRSGDLGFVDAEGRLFVTGRIKDLIIVNGKNYYAHDIAAKIEELPFVRRGKTHVFSYNVSGEETVVVMTVLGTSMSSAVRGRLEDLKTFLSTEPGSWFLGPLGEQTRSFVRRMSPEDIDLLKEEIKRYLLREFGLPIHDVFVVQQIPRTSSGKVRREECEALYRQYLEAASEGEGLS